jgi:hypothetical protein
MDISTDSQQIPCGRHDFFPQGICLVSILSFVGNKVTVTFVRDFLGKKSPEVTVTCDYQ